MPTDNLAVDRDACPWTSKNLIADGDFTDGNVLPFPLSAHCCAARQQINQPLNRLAASTDRQTLQNLRHEDKKRDDESGKDFANRERRYDSDGHRELHRHAALRDVLVRFVKDRKAANQSANHTDGSYVGIRAPRRNQMAPAATATNNTRLISRQFNACPWSSLPERS